MRINLCFFHVTFNLFCAEQQIEWHRVCKTMSNIRTKKDKNLKIVAYIPFKVLFDQVCAKDEAQTSLGNQLSVADTSGWIPLNESTVSPA